MRTEQIRLAKATNQTPENLDGVDLLWYAIGRIEGMQAEIDKLEEVLSFVERWTNHHAQKPRISAEEALSVIQHHPAIKRITRGYSDGVVPSTFDPYAELEELRKDRERLDFFEWNYLRYSSYIRDEKRRHEIEDGYGDTFENSTIRGAIDNAMRGEK